MEENGDSSRSPCEAFSMKRSRAPQQNRLWATIAQTICRIDVCWTFFYFLFLVCVAALTTSITQTKISAALRDSLHSLHNTRITAHMKQMNLETERVYSMAAGYLSLHSQHNFTINSEDTISTLCAILAMYDKWKNFRFFGAGSLEPVEGVACMHADPVLGKSTLYAFLTVDSVTNGTYLVDNTTYRFQRPLEEVYGGWPPEAANTTNSAKNAYKASPLFSQVEAYFNGTLDSYDQRHMWLIRPGAPHLLYFMIPAGLMFRGFRLPPSINLTDYVQVRMDGTQLVAIEGDEDVVRSSAMVLINGTLNQSDPWVMSNNWGQASVNDTEILTVTGGTPLSYLHVSNISDPVMRAAMRHVNPQRLLQEGYNSTVDFQYDGAPATVTAITYATSRGLVLPLVFATPQSSVAGPYRRIMNICTAVLVVVVVAFTILFWLFVRRYLHRPLTRVTQSMLRNLRTGHRTLARASHAQLLELTEAHALVEAHDCAMRQLREIDAFVPEAARRQLLLKQRRVGATPNSSLQSPMATMSSTPGATNSRTRISKDTLQRHMSTVVYVSIRKRHTEEGLSLFETHPLASAAVSSARNRLATVVANAARCGDRIDSGPFPSPQSLEAFAEKVHSLSEQHSGIVSSLTPESCVLHFNKRTRDHLLSSLIAHPHDVTNAAQSADPRLHCFISLDAKDAFSFVFALQQWTKKRPQQNFPEVRALLDTSMFTCGHYRPLGSERTMHIAMGRDVQREVGSVPAQIGVRVAMTEETASCVRAGQRNDATGEVETGVRQIPVEALRTGRAGLDGDVVILYEALPGPVLHCEPWQRYQHCCFNAFSAMVRGDYVAALRCYKAVADISDLEPGLMPASLRREAASSDVTGGAVSVQVERLMRECVAHIMRGSTEGYRRARHVPFGIDAVMQHAAAAPVSAAAPVPLATEPPVHTFHSKLKAAPTTYNRYAEMEARVLYPEAAERRIIQFTIGKQIIRTVIASPPKWLRDESGLVWRMATRPIEYTPEAFWRARFLGLGSAGALATINFMAFREIPPMIANAIRDAPIGPMSDALRSAVPVFCATPQQKANVHTLFRKVLELQHPNLLVPLGYSTSPEGGVALVWEFFAGGTLRQVAGRYAFLKPITISRFMHGVLSALVFLHKRGLVHGSLHMDNVMVGADGTCKVHGHTADTTLRCKLCVCPRTCCVSPAMAAGAAPTPACDMFCYGLMCLEMLSGKRPWKWAAAREDGQLQRSEEELEALMKAADQPFYDAVVDGSVVVNTDVMIGFGLENVFVNMGRTALLKCLSYDPAQRPTSAEALQVTKAMLRVKEASN